MSPAAELQAKAVAMLRQGDKLAIASDARAHAGKVILALARPEAACVLQIDASEYDGIKVLQLAGLGDVLTDEPMAKAPPDIEELKQARQALRQRKPAKTKQAGAIA